MTNNWVRERYAAGETVFKEGDMGAYAYLIEDGKVDIVVTDNGEREVLATLHPSQMFGEIALVDNLPRTASAIVAEDCTLIPITRELLMSKMQQSDPLLSHLFGLVVDRYREAREGKGDRRQIRGESTFHQADAIYQLQMAQLLNDALEQDEFLLHYQPIVNLDTGRLAGLEALIRWNRPDKGLVSPLEFIEIAEGTGLIIPIGRWVLRQALADLPAFQEAMDRRSPDSNIFMNVNLSAKQLVDPTEADNLIAIIRDSGIEPGKVKFEVTECILIANPDQARAYLMKLKEFGTRLAIDDFGTGWSSLSYLAQFPLDTLKIAQPFIATMHEQDSSHRITRAIAGLAADLELGSIAEGIENPADVGLLLNMGCQLGQGYFFSKPKSRDDVLEYIAMYG